MIDEEAERDRLLERIREYANAEGIAGLSIERIAERTGRPVAEVRQYFESDTDLMTALVARNRIRLREGFSRLDGSGKTPVPVLRRLMWNVYLDAADDSRLFFEAYGLALHDPHYGVFLTGVGDWLQLLVEALVKRGVRRERATTWATLTLAVYRGAMLDYCTTGDRSRVNAAMELWFEFADRLS